LFNAVIITEATGKIEFEGVIENVTYKVESDEATGLFKQFGYTRKTTRDITCLTNGTRNLHDYFTSFHFLTVLGDNG